MHISVQEGSVEEATACGGRGGADSHLQGIQCLWAPPGDGGFLPIPGVGDIGSGRQLAGSSQELVTGEYGVEEDDGNN